MQAFFFDFDGTLLDTEADIRGAYAATFRQLALTPGAFRIGPSLPDTVRMIKPDATDAEIGEISAAFARNYDRSGFPETRLYDGVPEMLTRLAQTAPLFIATNKRLAPTLLLLDKFNLTPFFRKVYASDMLLPARRLSKVEMLLLALEENQLDAGQCVIVGDTVNDIRGGRDAGMKTIAVTYGYAAPGEFDDPAPDRIAASASEVPGLTATF